MSHVQARGACVVEACCQFDHEIDQGYKRCFNLLQRNHLLWALSSEKPSQGRGWFALIAVSSPEESGRIRRGGGPVIDQGR